MRPLDVKGGGERRSSQVHEVMKRSPRESEGRRGMKRLMLAGLVVLGSVGMSIPATAGGSHFTVDGLQCTIEGTSGNDILVGSSNRDVICGLAGRDVIVSVDLRRDRVDGGRGVDSCTVDALDTVRRCELP
jgi:hypothetical protein